MLVNDCTAFVTGGSTGLGAAFVEQLLAGGARKIYVASRDPRSVDDSRVVPITMDVTDSDRVAQVAAQCGDVSLVINNAGTLTGFDSVLEASTESIHEEFDVNVFGPLRVCRAFAPVLRENGGGAIINVHSLHAWSSVGNAYSISKTALWGLTNAVRGVLRDAGTQVLALHVGAMDTHLTEGFDIPKADPTDVASATLRALAAGKDECLYGDDVLASKRALSGDVADMFISGW